ncbi:MAG: helix-turn-helix transcriptional regulator [Acutalibacter muris]|nr:helix-turn-helix transcriptional regulator [Acutalibacter muris]
MQLSIGEKIALLRKRKDVTQTQLAEYLFLAPQTVSRWESGGGTPDIALLPKIAAFFGISIDELFGATSLERTADLVSKYSVLRDDRSFREAMDYIDSQLQTINAALSSGSGDPEGLEKERDQRQEFEKLLSVFETDGPAKEIAFPTSVENLPIWCQLVHAAAETGDTGFIEQYLPPVLAVCGPALEIELSGLTSGSFKTFLCSPFKCAREYAIIKIYCDF